MQGEGECFTRRHRQHQRIFLLYKGGELAEAVAGERLSVGDHGAYEFRLQAEVSSAREHVHQGRLARSTWSEDGQALAGLGVATLIEQDLLHVGVGEIGGNVLLELFEDASLVQVLHESLGGDLFARGREVHARLALLAVALFRVLLVRRLASSSLQLHHLRPLCIPYKVVHTLPPNIHLLILLYWLTKLLFYLFFLYVNLVGTAANS